MRSANFASVGGVAIAALLHVSAWAGAASVPMMTAPYIEGIVGDLTASLSSGSPGGTWSITKSGVDNAGTSCVNYGKYFEINNGYLYYTSLAKAGTYPGVCATYTQSNASNSPYTQAFTITGSP